MKETHFKKLKEQKLKLTPKRQAILDCFIQADTHLSPDQVWGKLKKDFKQLGVPSIYRNLEAFCDCGILVKIQRHDRRLYYALCKGHEHNHHHHHIVCIKCGRVDDVDGCSFEKLDTINGFKVIKHTVQLEGLCPVCLK